MFRLNCVALFTIVRREVMRFSRLWIQTLLPPAVTTVLYYVIFGSVIGERIGTMGNTPYMDYIVPGLTLMSVIVNSYANVVSSFYSSKFHRSIEEMLIAPVSIFTIMLGYVAGGVLRGLCAASIVLLISTLFVDIPFASPALSVMVALMTAVLFALAGLINGIFANSFDDISVIPTFVLTPLTYLGGVFFSISALSSPWKEIAYFNPIFHLVDSFRLGLYGFSELNLTIALSSTMLIIVALAITVSIVLSKGIGIKK